MKPTRAEELRRRLVGGTESGLPRKQIQALAREAIEYAAELEVKLELVEACYDKMTEARLAADRRVEELTTAATPRTYPRCR